MNINLQGPCNQLGYGVATTQLALSLDELGHNIAWWFIGPHEFDDCYKFQIDKMIRNQELFQYNAPSIKIWHQFDLASRIGTGIHCGMPIFELDRLTQREAHHLNSLDKIFVCSHWAMDVVNHTLPRRSADTYVIPLGVNRSIFNETIGSPQPGWTTFLAVGKWEVRKGHDVLIEAFNKAFTPRDRVRLWMMTHNPLISDELNKEWENKYKNTKMGAQISFIPREQSQSGVAAIMGDANCGVFPAKAEGWNLELLEMMSMGKHVIATNYSAHTEFCDKDNCRLIEVDEMEEANDGMWFNGEGQWAKFGESQIEQLINHMRQVHRDIKEGKILNNKGISTAERFSWTNSANRLIKCIEMDRSDR